MRTVFRLNQMSRKIARTPVFMRLRSTFHRLGVLLSEASVDARHALAQGLQLFL